MNAVLLPLAEGDVRQGPATAAPVYGVPAIAKWGTRGPSFLTSLGAMTRDVPVPLRVSWRALTLVGAVWLAGLLMGSVMTTGMAVFRRAKATEAWSDQVAFSSGYRALLLRPTLLAR